MKRYVVDIQITIFRCREWETEGRKRRRNGHHWARYTPAKEQQPRRIEYIVCIGYEYSHMCNVNEKT